MIKFAAPMFLIVLAACAAQAQTLKLPASLDKLAARAKEVVDIKLDANLLSLAAKPHAGKEAHGAIELKNVGKLKGGFVRSYEFEQVGEYSQADVEAIRSQLRGPGWSCMVNVRNNKKGETAQVCLHATDGAGDGFAVVSAEPKSLTIVNLLGAGDLSDLGSLGDHFQMSDRSLTNKP